MVGSKRAMRWETREREDDEVEAHARIHVDALWREEYWSQRTNQDGPVLFNRFRKESQPSSKFSQEVPHRRINTKVA